MGKQIRKQIQVAVTRNLCDDNVFELLLKKLWQFPLHHQLMAIPVVNSEGNDRGGYK